MHTSWAETMFEMNLHDESSALYQRCGYRTGKCSNPRALKRNGKVHKLCNDHREKANLNQKKLDRKKRMRRFSPYLDPMDPGLTSSSGEDTPNCEPEPSPTSIEDAPLLLGFDEIEFFCNAMTNRRANKKEKCKEQFVKLEPTDTTRESTFRLPAALTLHRQTHFPLSVQSTVSSFDSLLLQDLLL